MILFLFLGDSKNEDEVKDNVHVIEKSPELCEESAGEESDTSGLLLKFNNYYKNSVLYCS